jgi:hypothetical protein
MKLIFILITIAVLNFCGCLSSEITGQQRRDNPHPAEFDSAPMVKSNVTMSGPTQDGLSTDEEVAYEDDYSGDPLFRTLRWFKKEQNKDGSWSSPKDPPGVATALALLCFLSHGDTPASEEFGKTVEKALRFLIAIQDENGRFAGTTANPAIEHGILALALCETYGVTRNPIIKGAAIKALSVIIKSQLPSGLWSSTYDKDGVSDIEASIWQIRAIKEAKNTGLWRDVKRLEMAYANAVNPINAHFADGTYTKSLAPVIAILQRNGNDTAYRTATETLNVQDMNWTKPPYSNPIYQWYFITMATFWHGGTLRDSWKNIVHATLSRKQIVVENGIEDEKGRAVDIGYWVSPSKEERYGKIYATSLSFLMLMINIRYGCGCPNGL